VIDQAEPCGSEEPAVWVRWDPVARPVLGRRKQGLLDRVLGCVEIPGTAPERAEDLRRQLAQQVLEVGLNVQRALPTCSRNASISVTFEGAWSMTCRTWMGCCVGTPPGPGTAETFAAISIARASDSTSTIW
jgi:hypothetical protein